MNLSKLTKMAALALDEQESGNEDAPAELHAFCLEHVEDVANALGMGVNDASRAIAGSPIPNFPKQLLASCRSGPVRQRARAAKDAHEIAEADRLAADVAASSTIDGVAWQVNAELLATLARAVGVRHVCVMVDGVNAALFVPARPIKDLARVHKPTCWTAHVTCPVGGQWQIVLRWSETGGWKAGHVVITSGVDVNGNRHTAPNGSRFEEFGFAPVVRLPSPSAPRCVDMAAE